MYNWCGGKEIERESKPKIKKMKKNKCMCFISFKKNIKSLYNMFLFSIFLFWS